MKNSENTTTLDLNAMIIADTEENVVTIGLVNSYGPIVSAKTKELAIRKFNDAMRVWISSINLMRTDMGILEAINFNNTKEHTRFTEMVV